MSGWIFEHYDLWRALHIISVIAWMAGIMYLPRLYSYHVKAGAGTEMGKTFETMERKLLKIIMTPAMILTFTFGAMLIYVDGAGRLGWSFITEPWMLTKLAGVAFMAGWHEFLAYNRPRLADGTSRHSEKFWRAINEAPFIVAAIMVLAVTTEFKWPSH